MKKRLATAITAGVLAATGSVAAAGEIAVIVKTTNSNFWQNVNKGAAAAIARSSRAHDDFQRSGIGIRCERSGRLG